MQRRCVAHAGVDVGLSGQANAGAGNSGTGRRALSLSGRQAVCSHSGVTSPAVEDTLPARVLALQQSHGNAAVARMIAASRGGADPRARPH